MQGWQVKVEKMFEDLETRIRGNEGAMKNNSSSTRSDTALTKLNLDDMTIKMPELKNKNAALIETTDRTRMSSRRLELEKQFAMPLNLKPTMTIRGLERLKNNKSPCEITEAKETQSDYHDDASDSRRLRAHELRKSSGPQLRKYFK